MPTHGVSSKTTATVLLHRDELVENAEEEGASHYDEPGHLLEVTLEGEVDDGLVLFELEARKLSSVAALGGASHELSDRSRSHLLVALKEAKSEPNVAPVVLERVAVLELSAEAEEHLRGDLKVVPRWIHGQTEQRPRGEARAVTAPGFLDGHEHGAEPCLKSKVSRETPARGVDRSESRSGGNFLLEGLDARLKALTPKRLIIELLIWCPTRLQVRAVGLGEPFAESESSGRIVEPDAVELGFLEDLLEGCADSSCADKTTICKDFGPRPMRRA